MPHPFQLPFEGEGMLNGDWIFLITLKGGGTCNIIFEKKSSPPCPLGWMKFFGCHLMVAVWLNFMVTKKIWLPFDTPPLSDGNQIFSVTKKGGCIVFFGKPLTRTLHNIWHALFYGDQKVLVAIEGQLNFFLLSQGWWPKNFGSHRVAIGLVINFFFQLPFVTRVAQMSMKSFLCLS